MFGCMHIPSGKIIQGRTLKLFTGRLWTGTKIFSNMKLAPILIYFWLIGEITSY